MLSVSGVLSRIEAFGPVGAPLVFLFLFLAASLFLIWRLESLSKKGVEGTVLGTLCMPYLSGLGNLLFVFVVLQNESTGSEVIVNCLVNNTTNMTLLLGLPALLWGLHVLPRGKAKKKESQIARGNRLSLLLTLVAMLFFTGVVWALGRDGLFDFGDGLTLIALFIFWQIFHVYEVLKDNIQKPKPYGWSLLIELVLLLICGWLIYVTIDWLVTWFSQLESDLIRSEHLGLLSGWLMVLPNALLAFYYAARRRADVVYTSQVGDAHICIPLCLGVFAIFRPMTIPESFTVGVLLIAGATVVHLLCVGLVGRLPRLLGGLLVVAYCWGLIAGFV